MSQALGTVSILPNAKYGLIIAAARQHSIPERTEKER
jgi:hypothetical protein